MMVWSRHDFTQKGDETAFDRRCLHPRAQFQRDQIVAWINEGGAGGEPPE